MICARTYNLGQNCWDNFRFPPSSYYSRRELKHARFWDANGNRKWAVFLFNLSSHNHISIATYLFSIRDDWYKNLGDTTVPAAEIFSSGCRPRLKNALCLSSLMLIFHGLRNQELFFDRSHVSTLSGGKGGAKKAAKEQHLLLIYRWKHVQ